MISSRKRSYLIIGILTTAVLVLILLPFGIEYGIVKALNGQGAEDASVRNVDFNPFTGRLIVQDLSIREGSMTPFNISELEVQISWLSLFKKQIYLETLSLEKLNISIEQMEESGWKIGGLQIPGDKNEVQEAAAEEHAPSPWGFGIENLAIRSSHIKFSGMDLESELAINALDISDVKSWEPDLETTIDFSGGLNESILTIKAALTAFSEFPYVKGNYSLDKLTFSPFNPLLKKSINLSLEKGSISSEGRFKYSTGSEEDRISYSGGVAVNDLSIAVTPGTPLLAVKIIDLRKIEVADLNDISVKAVEIRGIESNLIRLPDGKWNFSAAAPDVKDNEKEKEIEKEKSEGDEEEPLRIRIDDVLIADNSVRFEDKSLDPPYRTELKIDRVEIHGIDSSSPDMKSKWSVKGSMGEFSSLLFSGDIQPFAERPTMSINGKIEQVDLHPLSSYSVKALGYEIQSGHMESNIDIKITAGNIESENSLVLKKLVVSPKDETRIEEVAAGIGISIESAISLLRDNDGTIRLKLPVVGDIDNPDIGINDIISKALVQAMKKTAFSYLKNVIQPYGTLITIVQLAGEKVARIQLDPIEFEAGTNMLNPDSGEYIKTIAKLLIERPELEVSICGKTSQKDIDVLTERTVQTEQEKQPLIVEIPDEELLQFARERADNVKKALTEKHGIGSGRLFICNPEIDRAEEAKPIVDLLI